MIRITQRQIDMVKNMREDQYRARVVRFVVSTFPGLCRSMPPEKLAELITRAHELGVSYDITGKQELQRFIGYHFLLPECKGDLLRLPWMRKILKDKSLRNGSQRMMLIDDAVHRYIENKCEPAASSGCS